MLSRHVLFPLSHVPSPDLSLSRMIWHVKRQNCPSPSLHRTCIQHPVLWHQNVACSWKACLCNRQSLEFGGGIFSSSSFSFLWSRSHSEYAIAFKIWSFFYDKNAMKNSQSVTQNDCSILHDILNFNTNILNSHAIHFKFVLLFGLRFLHDCPCWKMFTKQSHAGLPSIYTLLPTHSLMYIWF